MMDVNGGRLSDNIDFYGYSPTINPQPFTENRPDFSVANFIQ